MADRVASLLGKIPEASTPWLLGVARNVLRNQRRSVQRKEGLQKRLVTHSEVANLESSEQTDTAGSEVLSVLRTLSEIDQEVLCLVAWDGLRPREAARVMGQTPAWFSVRLFRARKRFQSALQDATDSDRLPVSLAKEFP